MNLENIIQGLPAELQEKARRCGSVDELLALSRDGKVELSPEALAAVGGGKGGERQNCPVPNCQKCGSDKVEAKFNEATYKRDFTCKACGYKWSE